MAMNSIKLFRTTATIIVVALLIHLLSPILCSDQPKQPPDTDTTRDLLFEGKTRLGSAPPSCHNKCNQCHPCLAIQVPTMPTHVEFQPGLNRVRPTEFYDTSSYGNKYSNYKPLGWKCRCSDHFYNP
ncbi:EPIDERMAL PATTERNING FACTOR-like protein 1 [Actinidia eriantha]|uniref:EPIDERMAL PATTERNING FACTOR-like protein 1 n=1 Tax=Actinidia eriantha TaxID=165200 RepID=UPI00258ED39D|nr:EPIDERMAL PATTERNING FACTOR-like protein 1 [Actinidia eriantha]